MPRKKDSLGARVYVCSAYSADDAIGVERNVALAKHVARLLTVFGFDPRAPHLYYTGFLDDARDGERELGLAFCRRWIEECEAVVLVVPPTGKYISSGMARDLRCATRLRRPVVELTLTWDSDTLVPDLLADASWVMALRRVLKPRSKAA